MILISVFIIYRAILIQTEILRMVLMVQQPFSKKVAKDGSEQEILASLIKMVMKHNSHINVLINNFEKI